MGTSLNELSNEELVRLSQNGNSDAKSILSSRFIYKRGNNIAMGFLEPDDFVQESMFGFLRAIDTYDFSKGVPFEAYAFRCMQNSIKNAVGKSNQEIPVGIGADIEPSSAEKDPLNKLLETERLDEVLNACEMTLSDVEKTVVFFRAGGMSYEEIGEKLNMSAKSVDNALQRARNKLKNVCK
ncbi:MAG: sigma-70 family RNA polymerase sigma factor [Acutalibacteraceae bacterium]